MTTYEGYLVGFYEKCAERGLPHDVSIGLIKQAIGAGVPLSGNSRMIEAPDMGYDNPEKSNRLTLDFPNGLIVDPNRPFTSVHSFMSGVRHSGLEDRITPELIAQHLHIPAEQVTDVMKTLSYDKLDQFTPEQLSRLDKPGSDVVKATVDAHREIAGQTSENQSDGGSNPQTPQSRVQDALNRLSSALKKEKAVSFLREQRVPLVAGGAALAGGGLLAYYMAKRRRDQRRRQVIDAIRSRLS